MTPVKSHAAEIGNLPWLLTKMREDLRRLPYLHS